MIQSSYTYFLIAGYKSSCVFCNPKSGKFSTIFIPYFLRIYIIQRQKTIERRRTFSFSLSFFFLFFVKHRSNERLMAGHFAHDVCFIES